jgi:outer membrane protein OmpA-like peptidoglycan-associated protein
LSRRRTRTGPGSWHRAAQVARLAAAGFALAGLTVACVQEPPELAQVRASYERAAADAAVRQRAGVEIYAAEQALGRAESTWSEEGNYDEAVHLAYLASRKVEIARVASERRAFEEEIASLPGESARLLRQSEQRSAASLVGVASRVQLVPDRAGDLERLLEKLDAEPTERGVVTLGDVLFDFDRAEPKPAADENLAILAEFLRTHPGRSVLIEGHTDGTGVLEYNFDLSRRRAVAVKSRLEAAGISDERILAVGYGPVYPVASNATASGRAQNRRVEVVLLGRGEALDATPAAAETP